MLLESAEAIHQGFKYAASFLSKPPRSRISLNYPQTCIYSSRTSSISHKQILIFSGNVIVAYMEAGYTMQKVLRVPLEPEMERLDMMENLTRSSSADAHSNGEKYNRWFSRVLSTTSSWCIAETTGG